MPTDEKRAWRTITSYACTFDENHPDELFLLHLHVHLHFHLHTHLHINLHTDAPLFHRVRKEIFPRAKSAPGNTKGLLT